MTDPTLALLLDRFVRRLHLALQRKAPEFDTEGVGPWGGMVLLMLHDLGPVPIHVLTEELMRDKSQMTRSLRALEDKGLLARRPAPQDQRVSIVALTAKGQAVVGALQRVLTETIDELLGPLPPAEVADLKRLLTAALSAPSDPRP
ncbi:MAG: MarR family transcriptional regulator [Paracoccaceae bacterium]|nr:MarR family transcriptional regulator [Paracoccaceae bacterium]